MKSRALLAAACAAASIGLAGPLWAKETRSVTTQSGCGGQLSASATVSSGAAHIRVTHRRPSEIRGPGEHLHVCVRGDGASADIVRRIAPRSPKAHLRRPGDRVSLTVPLAPGASMREIRVSCIHGPHAACKASGAHGS
ncbi:MAG: hypothetical protein IT577_04735 [Verrucomicrobiae bacterium]|nr:hypothetical protein [Verrucomicrobiae bacterium]